MIRVPSKRTSAIVPRRVGALLMAAFAASACAGDADSDVADGDEPVTGGTVVIAGPNDFDFLNGLLTADKWTMEMTRFALFLPLIGYDPELEFTPALAESWEMEGDTAVVFRLRRDVRWHDGAPTTARDVAFTYERAIEPETGFPNAAYFADYTGVETPDSFTVRFTFAPHADPLAGLPFTPIMPAHLLDSIPPGRMRQAAFNRAPVGNGPFRFSQYQPNDRWVFEANTEFPQALGGRPYVDRLVWRIIPDATAQLTELRTGGVDLALAPPSAEFARLDSLDGVRGITRESRQVSFVGWNGQRGKLQNPVVRRALSMALNRQALLDVRYGYGTVAAGPVPPYHWGYPDDVAPLSYSPDSARALLASAGIENRDSDPMLETEDGEDFGFELKIPANNAFNRDLSAVIQNQLAQIGVDVQIRPLDFNTLIGDVVSPERNFDAVLLAFESDFRLNLRDSFHTSAHGGQFQFANYSNPAVDSLIDRIEVTVDRDEARPMIARVQQILRDEQPWTVLYYYPELFAARDRLRGADMDIRGTLVNVTDWWVEGRSAARNDSVADAPTPDSAQ